MEVLGWIGRILFAMIFLMSGLGHLMGQGAEYAEARGVPAAGVSVRIAGLLAVVGGLSVLFWVRVDIGALCLLLFLLATAFKIHDFWSLDDPAERQNQQAHFMKNMSMAGATIVLWILYQGVGPAGL